MFASRNSMGLLAALLVAGAVEAQSVMLKEDALADGFFRVTVTMKLQGETKFQQENKLLQQPLKAQAEHEFLEKILEDKTLATGESVGEKAARIYKNAKAVITHNNRPTERTFRPDRAFLVTQRLDQGMLTYCPKGSLTREELELTEHFNTLAVTGLLPGKQVKVGEMWKIGREVAQLLCALEAVVNQDLTCKLEQIKDDVAHVSINGTASGIDLGGSVKILVSASSYQFDLKEKRLTALKWHQNDQREQGPASPAMSADVDITVHRTTIEQPAELNKAFLNGSIPAGKAPPPDMTRIWAGEPHKRFHFEHQRDWIMTAQTKDHTVLRLMEKGALVAQVTLTPWSKSKPGEMVSFNEFVSEMKKTPTWQEETQLGANENVKLANGVKGYRYAASGTLDGREVSQYFFLVVGPDGDHLVVAFTMNPNQAKDLGARDLDFVENISFPLIENANRQGPAAVNRKKDE